jgi:hypothetical protein
VAKVKERPDDGYEKTSREDQNEEYEYRGSGPIPVKFWSIFK